MIPYVWIDGPNVADVEEILEMDESVDKVELLADLDDERLYQMNWVEQIGILVQILVKEDGVLLSAQGNGEDWTLQILFPSRDAFSRIRDYSKGHGLSMEIFAVYNFDDGHADQFGLTELQQDTLLEAFERGYYNIPRETSMIELSNEMDVSPHAVSERFRRGHETLVNNTVVIGSQDKHG